MSLYSIGYLYTSTETKNDASMLWTVVELREYSQQWILLGNYLLIVLPEIKYCHFELLLRNTHDGYVTV